MTAEAAGGAAAKLAHAGGVSAYLGVFFAVTSVPIIVVRANGEFVGANDAAVRQYGYALEELLEMRIHDLQASRRDIDPELARASAGTTPTFPQRPHRRRDGSILWVVPTTSPIEFGGERLIVSLLKDVTDLIEVEGRARKQLASADRYAGIGRLTASILHEVNNQVGVALVSVGVLKARLSPDLVEQRAIADDALDGLERVRELTRDLRGITRDRADDLLDLSEVVKSTMRIAATETRSRLKIELFLEEGIVVRASGARIARVVLNLLLNSIEAAPLEDEPAVVVRTSRFEGRARLEIEDSKLAPALVQRLLEPLSASPRGGGIGLWVVREIVEEEGGTLTLREGGGGVAYVIDLPAAGAPDARAEPSAAAEP